MNLVADAQTEKLDEAIAKARELISLLEEVGGFAGLFPAGEASKYPKRIMRLNELAAMGYSKEYLMAQYRKKGQKFAKKLDPSRSNSPIVFDTGLFEEHERKQQEMENRHIRRG